jgi:hypothetical protein
MTLSEVVIIATRRLRMVARGSEEYRAAIQICSELDVNDWDAVAGIVVVLGPIAEAVKTLEGQRYPTLSMLWPGVQLLAECYSKPDSLALKDKTTKQPRPIGSVARDLAAALLAELKARFPEATRVMQLATMCDPRYTSLSFISKPAIA